MATRFRWPNLIIGTLIAMVILNGTCIIVKDARGELLKTNCD